MTNATVLWLDRTAELVAQTDAPPSADECEQLLRSCDLVIFEVRGLADRLRAACVNNTPRPVPSKPIDPKPRPQPRQPPPPPPTKPGSGQ